MSVSKNRGLFLLAFIVVAVIAYQVMTRQPAGDSEKTVSFNRDIRPILNKNCTSCHGGVTKQGNISYIIREEALGRGKSGRRNVVPGDADASELIQRITSNDPASRMPFQRAALKDEEIDLLKQWISEGAEWEEHWAFMPPQRPPAEALPSTDPSAVIDYFIDRKKLERGLGSAPPASRSSWLRRVSLDLTGLPPDYSDVEAFLSDTSADAFEKQVDRLLASSAFGERWASMWLDIARYADSAGYERDDHRDVWPYRDWVVNAYNENIGYDEFLIRQLAGDLLPDATVDDHIATIFSRLTPINTEGGTDDEEFRTLAVMDRNVTTWAAFNGLTMNCVQCHSHPYDPIRHQEYYTSLAYFNTSQDADKSSDAPHLHVAENPGEKEAVYSQQASLNALQSELVLSARKISQDKAWSPLQIDSATIDEDAGNLIKIGQKEADWAAINEEARNKTKACFIAENDAGKNAVKDDFCATSYSKYKRKYRQYRYSIELREKIEADPTDTVRLGVLAGEYREEKPIIPATGVFEFTSALPEGASRPEVSALKLTVLPFDTDRATHTPDDGFGIDGLLFEHLAADGTRSALSVANFIPDSSDGISLYLTNRAEGEEKGRFVAHRVYHPVSIVAVLGATVTLNKGDRIIVRVNQIQQANSRDGRPYYLTRAKLAFLPSEEASSLHDEAGDFAKSLQKGKKLAADLDAMKNIKVPVMVEQLVGERRATRLFQRGNYLEKIGDDLTPSTPRVFSASWPKPAKGKAGTSKPPQTRLDLAHWFVSDHHPLTARVAVNRYWEQLFGLGLVETLEDFGSIGTPPSHPELLDWLALYFQQDLKWDVKALLKTITLSATYRQDAAIAVEAEEQDPANQWLSRGPRQRLTAEMVRDQALHTAGLLSRKMAGPPVMPPQPPGLWQTVGPKREWVNSTGEDRYRRGIYTYIKRSTPYPSFLLFDDTGHVVSAARRLPTNTPLQALVTLNDIVYYEAATALGQRMQKIAQVSGFREGIDLGFKAVLSRTATDTELGIYRSIWTKSEAEYAVNEDRSLKAWTDVATVLLNSDEGLIR